MNQKYLTKEIIISIFLKRCTQGHSEISIKMDDISNYAEKLEKLLNENGLNNYSDIFVKTPVTETYDMFKNFLISYILMNKLGDMNYRYDTIELTSNEFLINKTLKEMEPYSDVIDKGCQLLTDEYFEEEIIPKNKVISKVK